MLTYKFSLWVIVNAYVKLANITLHFSQEIHKVGGLVSKQFTPFIKKGKDIPVTDRGGSYGCETSRLPRFLHNQLSDGGEVVSLMHRPPLIPGRFLVPISIRGRVDPRAIMRLEVLD
jgi:hypothetical protein